MSDDYTPTTDEIREQSLWRWPQGAMRKVKEEEFDRWLATHDQALREKIAKEIEVEMRRHDHAQIGFSAIGDAYAHAARIARGEQA